MTIHLGYEIGTGRRVSIPLQHIAVTGLTQRSGKTSTLEALIARSRRKALAFLTKRGEKGFQDVTVIPPYFAEPLNSDTKEIDWEFVEAMLEAGMEEPMRRERRWIIRASKGAKSLQDVHRNILETKGRQPGAYELLDAYFRKILPQVEGLGYSSTLQLAPGINAMDLRNCSDQMTALVISSAIERIYRHEQSVIVVVPEATKFIPQDRSSPVLHVFERFIREMAAVRNFLWLDSQDLATVNKKVLKSVGVYLLGVQKEENEVQRTLDHITFPRPTADDVRALGIGQFYVCYDQFMAKVYVQPTWADDDEAQTAALSGGGIIPPPS